MEAVGAFSAILTIATEFTRIYKRLRRCVRNLKHARRDIRSICDEVEAFSTLLCMFHRTVTDVRLADEGLSADIRSSKIAQCIDRAGKDALRKLKDILDDVAPLRIDESHHVLKRWHARWKWSERKEAWTPIQISLIRIQGSANMLMNMILCQDILHRHDSPQAGESMTQNEIREQLLLFTNQAKTWMARCDRMTERTRRMQDQQGHELQEVAAIAFRLAHSHMASHPELRDALEQNDMPPSSAGNPTTSTNSGSSGDPQIPPLVPERPRPPQSGPSSGHAPVPRIATPMSEIPRTAEQTVVPGTSLTSVPRSGAYSLDSESGASEGQPLRPTRARRGVPTALLGAPDPSIRLSKPRQSDTDLSEGPVIVDNGQEPVREEFRRPKRRPSPP